jgi:hypothetical protein
VLALSLGQAKTIAILIVIVLVALAIGSAWLMKTVAQKVAIAAILVLLALLVWSQRASLDECADKVREGGVRVDTTCSFFGRDINISTNSSP